jgi:hypothetical protein
MVLFSITLGELSEVTGTEFTAVIAGKHHVSAYLVKDP